MDIFLSQNNNKKNTKKCHKNTNLSDKRTTPVAKIQNNICCRVSVGTCKSFYPTLASEKVLCCWLKRFLFFKSRCFFILTDVIKSYCEKQFWKLLHLLTIDTQNINQIIVKIGFCSAAKIASTIKLIENDKRAPASSSAVTEGSPDSNLCRYRPISIDA